MSIDPYNWNGDEFTIEQEQAPERPQRMTWLDWALVIAAFVIAIAVGVIAAGGPS